MHGQRGLLERKIDWIARNVLNNFATYAILGKMGINAWNRSVSAEQSGVNR